MSRPVNHHPFTDNIIDILETHFPGYGAEVLENSSLLGYLNLKTRSANRGSKSRGSFANHYALYVNVEDYIRKGYFSGSAEQPYSEYEGARFSDLSRRQRELPFGVKLQNHALNSRLNDEFRKFYPSLGKAPLIRDLESQRYWVHEDLLLVTIRDKKGVEQRFNIAAAVIEIIDAYVKAKMEAFESFLATCRQIAKLGRDDPEHAVAFVEAQLQPQVDARVFEIVSYAVLKAKYGIETIWIGETEENVSEEALVLYKTGRTNANDDGIDFVMRPLGRFFQVTESIDASKYFLDIDKVQRFPITFVVKSTSSVEDIRASIRSQAEQRYRITAVVDAYMNAVEEIINVDILRDSFRRVVQSNRLQEVMDEIVRQSIVEFNYSGEDQVQDELTTPL